MPRPLPLAFLPLSVISLLFSSPPFSSIFLVAETAFSIRSFRRRFRVNSTKPRRHRASASRLHRPKLPRPLEKDGDKEVDASVVVPCISLSLSLSLSPYAEEENEVNVVLKLFPIERELEIGQSIRHNTIAYSRHRVAAGAHARRPTHKKHEQKRRCRRPPRKHQRTK